MTALLVTGCGYSVVRASPPAGVRRVAVAAFAVQQGPPALGAWVAASAASELAASPGVSMARSSSADAVLSGDVRLADDGALALAAGEVGPRAALAAPTLEVAGRLVGRDGTVLRAVGPLHARAVRAVSPAGAADRVQAERALREAAAAAGRAVVRALLAP